MFRIYFSLYYLMIIFHLLLFEYPIRPIGQDVAEHLTYSLSFTLLILLGFTIENSKSIEKSFRKNKKKFLLPMLFFIIFYALLVLVYAFKWFFSSLAYLNSFHFYTSFYILLGLKITYYLNLFNSTKQKSKK